eukprot:Nitzschia sp. Nitz4//scaffold29_size155292//46738//49469//NITZ4_002648-RA/size155292-augustus-gene-0.224-mRNA-1//-1//CDS//3329546418//1170//frame0
MATLAQAAGANVPEPAQGIYPNYEQDSETFSSFLSEHRILQVVSEADALDEHRLLEPVPNSELMVERVPCYHSLFQRIVDRDYGEDSSSTFLVEVPLSEIVEWNSTRGAHLAQRAASNTLRYHQLFASVIDRHLEGMEPSGIARDANATSLLRDSIDILQEHRLAAQQREREQRQQFMQQDGVEGEAQERPAHLHPQVTRDFPPLLMRRYELRILPLGRRGTLFPFSNQHLSKAQLVVNPPPAVSLRHVRAKSMGRLVTVTGMIVRATDVKPFCHVATYTCDVCGAEIYQLLNNQREFLPQRFCPACIDSKRKGAGVTHTLKLQTRGSKFVKFQELRLQELPSQVPMGHVPRSLSVYCRGELTRLAGPGDVITVDGVFLPQRVAESGFRSLKAGLMATLYLEAQHVNVHKKSLDESLLDSLSEEESGRLDSAIQQVATSDDPIGILSQSIAPEIFGHEDIKRALLLQLTGGVSRKLPDGMKIRGDINICLMGDPGVAKSQLLKHVASIAPRGVYTTGKGSSGVGLTAAVTKDTTTGELSLEGGALVLADRGICAIDEFDKMDESDRTAIHEVMEQQTVSIAKAGIVATLNARAAVLAAANPLYSRYNKRKSLSENINLPNSLLSRFDLMFLILDTPDMDKDMALARHVTYVHQNEGLDERQDEEDETPEASSEPDFNEEKRLVSSRLLREYVARARRHEPVITPDVAPYVVEAYVSLRMQDRPGRAHKSNDQTTMTARQLLSILRLGQALARLRFSDFVAREDVDEAIRLTHMSKASLVDTDASTQKREDVMSRVFGILRDYASTANVSTLELKLCEAMVLRKGFTAQQLSSCLEEYEALEIIQVDQNRTRLHFV